MSESSTPGAILGKALHKGVGKPVSAGLLYQFTSLKSNYPPQDMDEILWWRTERKSLEIRQKSRIFFNE